MTESPSSEQLRTAQINGMRALLDVLTAHPDLPIPYALKSPEEWVGTLEEVQRWAQALPGRKNKNYTTESFALSSDMGQGQYLVPEYDYYIPKYETYDDEPAPKEREVYTYYKVYNDVTGYFEIDRILTKAEVLAINEWNNVNKENEYSPYPNIEYVYGPVGQTARSLFEFRVTASRETVCTKKVIGTKTQTKKVYVKTLYNEVEEEVDIVEWECSPLLATE